MMLGDGETHESGIVNEFDLVWDRSESPRFAIAVEYPALDSFFDNAALSLRNRLRSSATPVAVMDVVIERMLDASAVAAFGMRKALWRDLLPRAGVSGALFTQCPIDTGPADIIARGVPVPKLPSTTWQPFGPTRQEVQRYGSGRPPWKECILDVEEVKHAYLLNQSPNCLRRFVTLMKFINMVCHEAAYILEGHKVNNYWVGEAIAQVQLVQKVAATAMYLAIWKGLQYPPEQKPKKSDPTLF
jgi:hypothetical protein